MATARLDEIGPGDLIDAPWWPARVTVTRIVLGGYRQQARVLWTAPEAEGVSWLSEEALVGHAWNRRRRTSDPYVPPRSPAWEALQSATVAGPAEDDALATLAAQMEGGNGG